MNGRSVIRASMCASHRWTQWKALGSSSTTTCAIKKLAGSESTNQTMDKNCKPPSLCMPASSSTCNGPATRSTASSSDKPSVSCNKVHGKTTRVAH